jgi:hypothetical protein
VAVFVDVAAFDSEDSETGSEPAVRDFKQTANKEWRKRKAELSLRITDGFGGRGCW